MGEAPQTRTQGRTASELAQAAGLDTEALELVSPTTTPRVFLQAMVERQLYADAVGFLAHALPRREAVWWAWASARRAAGEAPPAEIQAALDATELWIREPSDERGRVAMERAEAAGLGTPAGCAELAAFLSGSSMAPPNVEQAVPPGEFMAAKAIAGAIVLAAVATEPEKAAEKFQAFIQQGLDVVNRIKLWPDADHTS